MSQKFVNFTPHDIKIYDPAGERIVRTIPRSGLVCRFRDPTGEPRIAGELDGIRVVEATLLDRQELVNLPDPELGTVFITSILCLSAARALDRRDVVAPDTDQGVVRCPSTGGIIGITRLIAADPGPPDVVVRFGSSTYSNEFRDEFRDVDVMSHGFDLHASIRTQMRTYYDVVLDVHECVPELRKDYDGDSYEWVVEVPVWGVEDPSVPVLEHCGPTLWPVKIVRKVANTGPAQVRRLAATGHLPVEWSLRVEFDVAGEDPLQTYAGHGLGAWKSALERVPEQLAIDLPRPLFNLLITMKKYDALEIDRLVQFVRRSRKEDTGLEGDLLRDSLGFQSGGAAAYSWSEVGGWSSPYASSGWSSIADCLDNWQAATKDNFAG